MKPRPRDYLDDMLFRLLFIVAFIAMLWAASRLLYGGEPRPAACPALESPRHAALGKLAQGHAERQAKTETQGHAGFSERARIAMQVTGTGEASEICNQSWPREANATPEELWAGAVKDWKQSPSHWRCASKRHHCIGVGLARSARGIWFSCLLAVDTPLVRNPRPTLTESDLGYCAVSDTVVASNRGKRFAGSTPTANCFNRLHVEFGVDNAFSARDSSCFDGIAAIFLYGSPSKIGYRIIFWIPVQMSRLDTRMFWLTNKRFQYQAMHTAPWTLLFSRLESITPLPMYSGPPIGQANDEIAALSDLLFEFAQFRIRATVGIYSRENNPIFPRVVTRESGDWTSFEGRDRIGRRHDRSPMQTIVFRTARFQPGCSFSIAT